MSGARPTARMRANRANATRSTGPRTRAGKDRIARNSLMHGLAAEQLPHASSEVEGLTQTLLKEAGVAPTPALEAAARDLAQAQVYLLSVRAIRRRAWLDLGGTAPDRWVRAPDVVIAHDDDDDDGEGSGPQLAQALARREGHEPLRALERLERYERLALARRKWASRAFCDVLAAQVSADGR